MLAYLVTVVTFFPVIELGRSLVALVSLKSNSWHSIIPFALMSSCSLACVTKENSLVLGQLKNRSVTFLEMVVETVSVDQQVFEASF